MHVRVTDARLKSGKMQDLIKAFDDSVVPAQKAQKGYQGSYLMTDASSGKGLSITVWETEADMEAGESSGYFQEQIGKFGGVFAGPPIREHYELSVEAGP